MRRYETFVIIDPDLSQDIRDQVVERVEELIAQMDGFLVFTDDWGERKLAYEIKKRARGYYVRFDYCGLSPLINEIERFFRIDDRALKYITVLLDKDADLEKVKEEKAAADAAAKSKTDMEEAPEETQKELETAPVELETAPVEVETAPVEVETAPVEVDAAPVEVETAPVEVETAPVEVDAAPVEVDAAPVKVDAAPVEVDAAPVEVDAAPVEESEVNREEMKKEENAPSSGEADSAVETTPLKNPEEA